MEQYSFDNVTIRFHSNDNSRAVYNDIMSSIRDFNVDDIIRNSPAFDEMEEEN